MKRLLSATLWLASAAALLIVLLIYEYVREYFNPRYEMRKL